jgi:superfamily II DNA or RNA helicase
MELRDYQLRDYQLRDLRLIKDSIKKTKNLFYQLPTGGGKSVVITEFVNEVGKNSKVLVLAHRRELLNQFEKYFTNKNISIGFMIAKKEIGLNSNVVIASINTAIRDKRLEKLVEKNFDYLIIDEAHRTASTSYETLINKLREKNENLVLIGASATPYRKDKKDLRKYYDELICSESIADLIKAGYLSNYKTYSTPVKDLDSEVEKNSDDYQITSLSNYMKNPERIKYAVESYQNLGQEKQVLVFCVDRSHAKEVKKAYETVGYKSIGYIDGETSISEREQIIKDYENKKIQILVSVETLTEGIDLPDTGCIQILRPTLSLTLYMQIVGRGLRKKSDDSELIILDCSGCTETFGVISSPKKWSLDPIQNPCSPRGKNKVVAKRKDGTFQENLDEAEFLELVEMDYEEYISKVINNEENAKKHNGEIKKKVEKIITDIFNFLLKNSKNEKYIFDEKNSYIYIESFSVNAYFYKGKNDGIRIKFYNSEDIKVGIVESHNGYNQDDYCNKIIDISRICSLLLEPKTKTFLITKFLKIKELNESLIDIREIVNKSKKAKEEIFEIRVKEFLEKNNELIFKNEPIVNRLFQVSWDSNYEKVNKIVFEKNILGYKNSIKIYNKDNNIIYESKSTKKDKVIDLFKISGIFD